MRRTRNDSELKEEDKIQAVVQELISGILDEGNELWKRVWGLMEEGRVRAKIVLRVRNKATEEQDGVD